jgi:hypothetical protein
MSIKIYPDIESALEDIENVKKTVVPCLEMVSDDTFEVPMYLPLKSKIFDDPIVLGTMKIKFSLNNIRPMISIGDWVLHYYFDVDIVEHNLNSNEYIDLFFKISDLKNGKFNKEMIRYSHFIRAMEYELFFFEKLCNVEGNLLINEVRWSV